MQLHPHETIVGDQQAGRAAPELLDASPLLLSGVAAVSARDCEFSSAHPLGQLFDGRNRVAVNEDVVVLWRDSATASGGSDKATDSTKDSKVGAHVKKRLEPGVLNIGWIKSNIILHSVLAS